MRNKSKVNIFPPTQTIYFFHFLALHELFSQSLCPHLDKSVSGLARLPSVGRVRVGWVSAGVNPA